MICLNIPLVIVGTFLLLTLLVGIYFSRKKTTFREYAVGNKQFATATLVATLLATYYGGSGLVRTVHSVHDLGLWWIIIGFLATFGFFIISKLALRMGPFMQNLSMAEMIGQIYGKYPRIIAALVGICGCVVGITMQINIISQTIGIFMSVTNAYVMPVLSTLLLIFYSTFGGIRAVTYTDVLQFITFSVIIPLLAWFMFLKVGKPVAEIFPILHSQNKFQFSSVFHCNRQLVSMLLLSLSVIVSYIEAPVIQKVYMASEPLQARKVFTYAAVFSLVIKMLIYIIGLFVFVCSPDLPKEEVWEYIV